MKQKIIEIENMNTFEKRKNIYTTQCRTIYEVIEEYYFHESDIFQMILETT